MSGGDRLSLLPDDLLRRVLHFSPAREGASTSVLSKRWRGLWRSSGAVNLDARIPDEDRNDILFSQRDAFISAARFSLEAAAADSPITRLTFCLDPGCRDDRAMKFLCFDGRFRIRKPDVVTELLSLPAARSVEELRLAISRQTDHGMPSMDQEVTGSPGGFNTLKFISLPLETLRVLDVTSSSHLEPSAGVAFTRLESLRLSLCSVWFDLFHDFINSAPVLATVHLEAVMFKVKTALKKPEEGPIVRLHCPAATVLVLDTCGWAEERYDRRGTTAVEINAPRLRRFTYKGLLRRLSLSSKAPDLAQVHLHILPGLADLMTFWQLVRNFRDATELKLRVNMLEDIAVIGSPSGAKILCSFRKLEHLQLEGMHSIDGKTASVAVANLLRCCPVLCDIRINLTTAQRNSKRGALQGRSFLEKKYRYDLEKSIHGFNNRKLESSMVSREGDYDDGDARFDELSDLPALSGHVFDCLLSTLSCVRLQFRPETNIFGRKPSSNFAAQLIKFFAENAAVLKEMHLDDGNGKMSEHMHCNLERWVANSSEKRKTAFVVLPLER